MARLFPFFLLAVFFLVSVTVGETAEVQDPQSGDDSSHTPQQEGMIDAENSPSESSHEKSPIELLLLDAEIAFEDGDTALAKAKYLEAAGLGSSDAFYELGDLVLQEEPWTKSSLDAAIASFNSSADYGNEDAQLMLGVLYSLGLRSTDSAASLLYFYFASLAGSAPAQMALGFRHLYGIGVPKSCETAALYYGQAAEQVVLGLLESRTSHIVDRTRLADSHGLGRNPLQDNSDIVQYYQHTADAGEPAAQHTLGQLHLLGQDGIEQDPRRAARYFEAAAEQGHGGAMAQLGQLYLTGTGVEQSNSSALNWYQKAAQKGDPHAQNGLGYMYLHGHGVKADASKALSYFKAAAAQGNAEAQFNLGTLYFTGTGVQLAHSTALQYFSLAAASGHTRSMYNLAQMHLNGLGTVRTCTMGCKLLKEVSERGTWAKVLTEAHHSFHRNEVSKSWLKYAIAAELGFEVAQSNAAWLLHEGMLTSDSSSDSLLSGTEPHRLALRHYKLASKQGNVDAIRMMGDYAYYGWLEPASAEKAAEYYMEASEGLNAHAKFNLAWMHQHGIGLPQDLHLAKRFFDGALAANSEAIVPVQVALWGLYFHETYLSWSSWWNQREGHKKDLAVAPSAMSQDSVPTTGDSQSGKDDSKVSAEGDPTRNTSETDTPSLWERFLLLCQHQVAEGLVLEDLVLAALIGLLLILVILRSRYL